MTAIPSVLDSERAALGAALRNPDIAEIVTTELQQEDFYNADNQKIFLALQGLASDGLAVSNVSVSERSGVAISSVGDIADAGSSLSGGQVKTLVSDIVRVSGLRKVYHACSQASKLARKDAKLEDVLEELEKQLYKLDRAGAKEAKDGTDVMQRVVGDILERFQTGGKPALSTGIKALDRAILGLRGGKMMVVAARPSMGKTALSGTLRRSVLNQGHGVIEFNLEMGEEEILEREIAFQSETNLRKIIAAKEFNDDELSRVRALVGGGCLHPGLWWVDDSTYNIAGIRRKARILSGRMARKGVKTGLVILDYIQLAGENGDGREQSVAAISRGCKLLAKELDCTVLALSQLNRACENRDDRRPMMADLRESGAIEQDADIVAFIYREHMYDNSIPPEDAELIIRKHRSGPTGTVRLNYNPKLVSFGDVPGAPMLTENVQDA